METMIEGIKQIRFSMLNSRNVHADPDFYKVNRDSLLDFKSLDQRLSSKQLAYEYDEDKFLKVAYNHLVGGFYSLFNYVSGEIVPCLVVKSDTLTSTCAMNTNKIQLGTSLLNNKGVSQQQRVDATYAVMLHEMYHKRFTNKHLGESMFSHRFSVAELYKPNARVKHEFAKLFPNKLFGKIFNILEDHRIERLGMLDFPGYVFFFDSLRELCVREHGKRDLSGLNISFIPEQFLIYKILIPELYKSFMSTIDVELAKLAKPKSKAAYDLMNAIGSYVDANHHLVYSENISEVYQATQDILKLIPNGIQKEQEGMSSGDFDILVPCGSDEGGELETGTSDGMEEFVGEMIEVGETTVAEGGIDTTQTVVRKEKIDIIEASHDKYQHVMIYNPKCKSIDKPLHDKALKLSKNISKNLGYIASRLNRSEIEFELSEGELDEDEVYSIGFQKDIFFEEEDRPGFEIDLGLLIDESGSMIEKDKRRMALLAALAILLGTKDSEHVNAFVYGHCTGRHGEPEGVEMFEYYNKKRGITDWRNIFMVTASGANADGYAIAKMGEIMLRDSKTARKILIVISDGLPSAPGYAGIIGEEHTKSVVDLLASRGILVVQICVDNIVRSPFMFKNYIPFTDNDQFVRDVIGFLQRQLMKFSDGL